MREILMYNKKVKIKYKKYSELKIKKLSIIKY